MVEDRFAKQYLLQLLMSRLQYQLSLLHIPNLYGLQKLRIE